MSINVPQNSPLFEGMTQHELTELGRIGEIRRFKADDVILSAGQDNHSIFVVTSGRARVERPMVEEEVELAILGVGAPIGEMSAIEGRPIGATVCATEPTELLELPREPLEGLLASHPVLAAKLWHNVARELTRRLVRTNALVEHYVDLNQVLTGNPEFAGLLGGT